MDLQKRLGVRPSPWDNKRLAYMVRSPTHVEAQQVPDEYDGLADYLPCQGDQGDVGTCAGWAAKGICHAAALLNDIRDIDFSAGSIYAHSREYADPPIPPGEEGSTALAVMKLLADKGAATEACAPTDTRSPFQLTECVNWQAIAGDFKIDSYHAVPVDPASLKAAIYGVTYPQPYTMPDGSPGKCPLFMVIQVYQSISQAEDNGGLVPLPGPGDPMVGYHAIDLRGWKKISGLDYWIFVNSWGLQTGDRGIYYFPVGYPLAEAWMITEDAPVPGPEPVPVPPTPSPCKVGNGIARAESLIPKILGRKGRFFYLNPGTKS